MERRRWPFSHFPWPVIPSAAKNLSSLSSALCPASAVTAAAESGQLTAQAKFLHP
jgi:hypothetical protein